MEGDEFDTAFFDQHVVAVADVLAGPFHRSVADLDAAPGGGVSLPGARRAVEDHVQRTIKADCLLNWCGRSLPLLTDRIVAFKAKLPVRIGHPLQNSGDVLHIVVDRNLVSRRTAGALVLGGA